MNDFSNRAKQVMAADAVVYDFPPTPFFCFVKVRDTLVAAQSASVVSKKGSTS